VNFLQALELAFAIEGDLAELDSVGTPTQPIKAGAKWYVVEQVGAPIPSAAPSIQ
jgi:hypothetical protein